MIPSTPAMTRPGLLRHPDFRRLWIGETTSRFGSGMTAVAIPLVAVQVLDAGPFMMGLLGAAAWIPWLLIALPAGAWVDRWRKRRVMVVCDLICIVALLTMPLAYAAGMRSTGMLLTLTLILGGAAVFFTTAYQSMLPALLDKKDLDEGNAKLQGSEQVASLAGPPAGGFLAQAFGALTGLVGDAITFAISALCLSRMTVREERVERPPDRSRLRAEIRDGLRLVLRDPYLRVLTLAASVDNLVLNAYMALIVLFLVDTVGVSAGAVGVLLTADAIGGLLGAAVARRLGLRFGTARATLGAALLLTPFGLLVPWTSKGPGLVLFVVGFMAPAAGMVIGNVLVNGFRQRYCPPEMLGRMYATSRFIQYGVMPFGSVLGGALGATVGVRPALVVLFGAAALGKLLRLIGPIRRRRDFPTEPPPPADLTPPPSPHG